MIQRFWNQHKQTSDHLKVRSRKPDPVVLAPSIEGEDREYTVILEKKAIYKRPSFARIR